MNVDFIDTDRVDRKTNLFKRNSLGHIRRGRLWTVLVVVAAIAGGGFLGLLTCPHTRVLFF